MLTLKHRGEVVQNFSECLFKGFSMLDLVFRGEVILLYVMILLAHWGKQKLYSKVLL